MKSILFLSFSAVLALAGLSAAQDAVENPKAPPRKKAASAELSPKTIYANDAPAVVLLMCTGADGQGELGTGSVLDEAGKIITNAHVVIRASTGQPYERIHVYFKPAHLTGDSKKDLQQAYEGRVTAYDRAMDLAVVEMAEKPDALKVLPIGDAEAVDAGEPVVAIGHPEQGGLWTLTTGVVSTVVANLGGVKGKNAFQTDASINRGNSGGPLINRQGAMIGVNTSMARKAADGLTITSVNFSLKSSVVKRWLGSSGAKVQYSVVAPESAEVAAVKPAPDEPQPAPADPKPAPQPPAQEPEKIVAKAPPSVKPKAPEAAIVTPKRPFKAEDMLRKEIAEMEDLEKEMSDEVDKRRDEIEELSSEKK